MVGPAVMVIPPVIFSGGGWAVSAKRMELRRTTPVGSTGIPPPGKASSPLKNASSPWVKPTDDFSDGPGGWGGRTRVAPPAQETASAS